MMKKLLLLALFLLPNVGHAALTTNLVSYWKLDESSGNAADSVGSNTLTNNGTTPFVAGKINNGADLERGSTQSFTITDAAQSGLDIGSGGADWSIAMWVNLETAVVSGWQPLFSKDAGDPQRTLSLGLRYVGGDNYESVQSSDGTNTNTNNYRAIASSDFSTGTWYYLVFTSDISTGNIKVYRNGSLDATITGGYTSYFNSTAQVELGAYSVNSLYFDGIIDEAAVWSRELTSAEVTELYNSGAGLQYPFSAPAATPTSILAAILDWFDS